MVNKNQVLFTLYMTAKPVHEYITCIKGHYKTMS